MNKIILSIVVIFLLPISVKGVEWTVEYEMVQPEGTNKFVKVSLPTKFENLGWGIPYLAGRWRCTMNRSDYPEGNSRVLLNCFLKEKQNVRISADVGCDNGYIRDTKENSMEVGLFGTEEGDEVSIITLECKV